MSADRKVKKEVLQGLLSKLEIGLEPTTPSLRVKCSTNCAIPAKQLLCNSHKYYYIYFSEICNNFLKKIAAM